MIIYTYRQFRVSNTTDLHNHNVGGNSCGHGGKKYNSTKTGDRNLNVLPCYITMFNLTGKEIHF